MNLGLLCLAAALLNSVHCLYSSSSPVKQLTPSNFDSSVKSGLWLVEFYAPWCGHCKNLKGDWEKTAKALHGIVNVAAVDADQHSSLAGKYGVRGFPTIKLLYAEGGKEPTVVDYNGNRTPDEFVDFAFRTAKKVVQKRMGKRSSDSGGDKGGARGGSKGDAGGGSFYQGTDVVTLTDSNFEKNVLDSDDLWLVEFYAPWCGHCQRLKPDWESAARELKGKVHVGAVDCTTHQSTCQEYGVQGYPTIKVFSPGKPEPSDYNSGRDSSSIVAFATEMWAAVAPPPEVVELVDGDTFEQHCTGHPGNKAIDLEAVPQRSLCLVAFLPDVLDTKADGRRRFITVLQELAKVYKGRPWGWMWVQGGSQAELEANVEVGGYGYPALVAFNPAKGKYAPLRSGFDFESIKGFIENLRRGFEKVTPIRGELTKLRDITPWDGKDAKIEEVEEFSLDDIMGDDMPQEE